MNACFQEKKRDGWIFKGIDNRNIAVLIDTTRDMIDYLKEIGTQLLRFLAKKSKVEFLIYYTCILQNSTFS